jgi:predicted nucleic acid-binding protein
MTSSPIPAARSQYLLDLLAQVPDPRRRRGRRHSLAGLLAVGIAAVIAGSRSFAAIGQWAADAGPVRSLDAIHLGTALRSRSSLTSFVTYDKRLLDAAQAAGLPIDAPA